MKRNFTLLLIIFSLSLYSQNVKLVSGHGNTVTLTNTVNALSSVPRNVDGISYQDFSSSKVLMMHKGLPALPVISESVMVPNVGNITLTVAYDSYEEFENINVLPSKGSLKRNVKPSDIKYSFGEVYSQDAFYPGALATLSEPYIIRDKRGVTVSFFPYQYNPVTKVLRVYNNLTVTVVADASATGINEVKRASQPNNTFNQLYRAQFLNAEDYQQVPENGEMLVIAPNEYLDVIQPLADWKVEKGIRTNIVTLAEAGFTPQNIRSFIQNYYQSHPALTYLLLIGDHENLPTHSYGVSGAGEEIWSDSYYGQLAGNDFFPEVLVGRFSGDVTDVSLMVSRTLEYEKNPVEGDWMTKTIGIGSGEGDGYGDDGEPDWQHLRGLGESLTGYGYTYVHEFYEGSRGVNDADDNPEPYMISDALNNGAGLLNYCGHGATEVFATGNYSVNDVHNLHNNGKYPFVVSVACNNGTFAGGTSLCEAFLTATNDGSAAGAIAACGSSILMAWAEPMQAQDEIVSLITDANPLNKKLTLGGLFYNGLMSVLEDYALSPTAIEVAQTWIFFGDPSVTFRSNASTALTAVHSTQIDSNANSLTVTCNVEGAVVAITQNGVIVGTGIVVNGEAAIVLNDFTEGQPLTVTVTGQNYTPYQGTVATGALISQSVTMQDITVYPNPAQNYIIIKMSEMTGVGIEMHDITGKLIYKADSIQMPSSGYTVATNGFSSGVYLLTIVTPNARVIKKVVIR